MEMNNEGTPRKRRVIKKNVSKETIATHIALDELRQMKKEAERTIQQTRSLEKGNGKQQFTVNYRGNPDYVVKKYPLNDEGKSIEEAKKTLAKEMKMLSLAAQEQERLQTITKLNSYIKSIKTDLFFKELKT
jgi:hypothetical protein